MLFTEVFQGLGPEFTGKPPVKAVQVDSISDIPADGGAGETPQTSEGEGQPKGGPDPIQALQRKLRKAEKERDELRSLEEDRKKSEMSAADRLKLERDSAIAERDKILADAAAQKLQFRFEALAAKAGAVDTEAAWRLVDPAQLDPSDESTIQAAIESQKASRKYLYGVAIPPSGLGAGANPPGGNTGKPTADKIRGMSAAEFAKYRADVAAGRI